MQPWGGLDLDHGLPDCKMPTIHIIGWGQSLNFGESPQNAVDLRQLSSVSEQFCQGKFLSPAAVAGVGDEQLGGCQGVQQGIVGGVRR